MDTTLPFSLRSAPMIFNAVAEALAYIMRQRGVSILDHYLNDFSIVGGPMSPESGRSLQTACEKVGFPVAAEKTEGPVTRTIMFGIELNSELEKEKVLYKAGAAVFGRSLEPCL